MTTFSHSDHLNHIPMPDRPRLRIACVYKRDHRRDVLLASMAEIRFFRMAEAWRAAAMRLTSR